MMLSREKARTEGERRKQRRGECATNSGRNASRTFASLMPLLQITKEGGQDTHPKFWFAEFFTSANEMLEAPVPPDKLYGWDHQNNDLTCWETPGNACSWYLLSRVVAKCTAESEHRPLNAMHMKSWHLMPVRQSCVRRYCVVVVLS